MAETAEKKKITISDPNGAPIVYFDGATNAGCNNGIVNVTLAAARNLVQNNELVSDGVAVAFLRCSVAGAIDLRRALDQAILVATPVGGDGKAS